MRLLVDARTLGDRPSGIGIYLYNFINEIKKHKDVELELLTDVVKSAELSGLKEEGITIYEYGKQVKKSIGVYPYFQFVQKMIYKREPDIFWEVNNLIPVKLKNPAGKVAVTIHDLFPISDPDCFPKLYCYYFRHGVNKTLRTADVILYDTQVVKQCVEDYYKPAANIANIVSSIIVDKMPELEINKGDYFYYVGNLERRKGTDLLLRAYVRYREQGGTAGLHLGGAVREKEIQSLLDSCMEKYSDIKYLGYISEEDKWKEYAGCKAFVFPSRAEGFGIPAVEAVHFQKPLILSKLAVFEEVIGTEVPLVPLYENEEQTIEALARQMEQVVEPDAVYYEDILNRYKGETLATELLKFFAECKKS